MLRGVAEAGTEGAVVDLQVGDPLARGVHVRFGLRSLMCHSHIHLADRIRWSASDIRDIAVRC